MSFTVVALYKFIKLVDPEDTKRRIDALCHKYTIFGALIMAHEGINGTISCESEKVQNFIIEICQIIPIAEHEFKFSSSENNPFYRMRTMIKPEIITMGCEDVDPEEKNGIYVDSKEWNQLLEDPNLLLIGTIYSHFNHFKNICYLFTICSFLLLSLLFDTSSMLFTYF